MDPPLPSSNRLIFPWNYANKSYSYNNFQPAKANFLDFNSIHSVMEQIKSVTNFDIVEIKPSCFVVWGVTIIIMLLSVISIVILLLTDFWWGLIIMTVIIGLTVYSMWSNITKERTRTEDKVLARKKSIDDI